MSARIALCYRYASDNGGFASGNNFPFRGEKRSNWEGTLTFTFTHAHRGQQHSPGPEATLQLWRTCLEVHSP